MKNRLVALLLLVACSVFGYGVNLTWSPSPDATVSGYNVYFGNSSGVYSFKVNAGNTNSVNISDITSPVTYFAATAYDTNGDESTFSNEAIWTNTSPVYLGEKVDFGTNIANLSSESIMTMVDDGTIGNFYSAQLVQTNNPVNGSHPNDGNYYVYICQQLNYGKSLTNMTSKVYNLFTVTNPPDGQLYRGQLVITNNPF